MKAAGRQVKLGGILCSACRVVLAKPEEVDAAELDGARPPCWCVQHTPPGRQAVALKAKDGRVVGMTLPNPGGCGCGA